MPRAIHGRMERTHQLVMDHDVRARPHAARRRGETAARSLRNRSSTMAPTSAGRWSNQTLNAVSTSARVTKASSAGVGSFRGSAPVLSAISAREALLHAGVALEHRPAQRPALAQQADDRPRLARVVEAGHEDRPEGPVDRHERRLAAGRAARGRRGRPRPARPRCRPRRPPSRRSSGRTCGGRRRPRGRSSSTVVAS